LREPAAVFVSWHDGERLAGCIGTLVASEPLEDAVAHYAVEAGLRDPRMPSVTAERLPRLTCEVSVLSAPVDMHEVGLDAITAALVPGRDGLVLRDGARRAVFLPVVWASLPEPRAFVEALCRKAGIDIPRRGPHVTAQRFTTEIWRDPPAE
jgi:AmmeMemoRadiSam system protein A